MGRHLAALAGLAAVLSSCALPQPADGPGAAAEPVAWVQLAPSAGPPLARALVGLSDRCPTIRIDGRAEAMRERPTSLDGVYGKICESRLPVLQGKLTVRVGYDGTPPLLEQVLTDAPARIAVLGDTGCRVTYYEEQKCGDAASWPFAAIARQAAALSPDLVLHAGDYFYREAPCLGSAVDCVHGPYGDNGRTWWADFFGPARALLARAPWVFSRGNHEDCERGGYGWYHYFGDVREACRPVAPTAILSLSNLAIVSFDTAQTDNRFVLPSLVKTWVRASDEIARLPGSGPVVLLTHRPAYVLCRAHAPPRKRWPSGCDPQYVSSLAGVRAMIDTAQATGRRTISLSGHVHTFQVMDIAAITQVVVGNSGTLRDEDYSGIAGPADVVEVEFSGRVGLAQVWDAFGFGLLHTSDLKLAMHDVTGAPRLVCDLMPVRTTGPRCR
jgi:hypothetical protein